MNMQTEQPDIVVVIVSWNVMEHLQRCLTSVTQQTGVRYTIVVVDNASSDASVAMVQQHFPSVTVIVNEKNLGFAKACNQGIAAVHGRHVLLLNPDTMLPQEALSATVRYLDQHPDVAVFGPKIVHSDGKTQRSVLRFPTLLSQVLVLFKVQALTQRPSVLRHYYALDFSYTTATDVDQVMGSFFAIQGKALQQLGNLDEQYFIWFEEVDFCKRARDAGWKVRYDPVFRVTHIGGTSEQQMPNLRKQRIFDHSMRHYARKHFGFMPWFLLLLLTPVNLLLAALENMVRSIYEPKPVR